MLLDPSCSLKTEPHEINGNKREKEKGAAWSRHPSVDKSTKFLHFSLVVLSIVAGILTMCNRGKVHKPCSPEN